MNRKQRREAARLAEEMNRQYIDEQAKQHAAKITAYPSPEAMAVVAKWREQQKTRSRHV